MSHAALLIIYFAIYGLTERRFRHYLSAYRQICLIYYAADAFAIIWFIAAAIISFRLFSLAFSDVLLRFSLFSSLMPFIIIYFAASLMLPFRHITPWWID